MSLRQRKLQRHAALKLERSSWDARIQEISDFILPFSSRFSLTDRNRGDKSFNDILDSTGGFALDILSAGMMAGMTSPARPWFRLATPDTDLMEYDPVKLWLAKVAQMMREIFNKSNTYRALHSMYEELGGFCTAATVIDENFDTVIWHHPQTFGEYCLSTDSLGRVNSMYREYQVTVAQLVEQFGNKNRKTGAIDWSNISQAVKSAWDSHKAYDTWVSVLHVIEPRAFEDREYGRSDTKNKPWASCYFEMNCAENKVLRESGRDDFDVLAPRWHTRGRDIYGHGPGFKALGDVKQLQHEQLRKGQGIDYQTLPPVLLPGELKGRDVDVLPGGVSFTGLAGAGGKGHNLMDVRLDLSHLLLDIQDVRQRINRAFYADLFLMISQDQRNRQVTAREVAERHEEKLLMLGPVLERLHDEMLSPLIDSTFAKMVAAGILPPPPEEMQGMELKVELVSTLAQAQRMVGLGSLDRLLGTVGLIAQGSQDMSVWDKVDKDQAVDKIADMLAVDPSIIVSDDKVAIARESRRQQQAAMVAAQAAPIIADTRKTMSETDTEGKNALTDSLMGYS
jgi:head-to-tail connecting protein